MKKVYDLASFTTAIFILVVTILMIGPGLAGAAEECRLVKITGTRSPNVSVRIEPETVSISKGDCVVWINWTRAVAIKVLFREGKKCEAASQAPVGFKMDAPTGCYTTGVIPLGATSSLMFVEEGTFDYQVEADGTTGRGRIVVKNKK